MNYRPYNQITDRTQCLLLAEKQNVEFTESEFAVVAEKDGKIIAYANIKLVFQIEPLLTSNALTGFRLFQSLYTNLKKMFPLHKFICYIKKDNKNAINIAKFISNGNVVTNIVVVEDK